jgi:hypothetical protein
MIVVDLAPRLKMRFCTYLTLSTVSGTSITHQNNHLQCAYSRFRGFLELFPSRVCLHHQIQKPMVVAIESMT